MENISIGSAGFECGGYGRTRSMYKSGKAGFAKILAGIAAVVMCMFYIMMITVPILAIVANTGLHGILSALENPGAFSAIRLSLTTTAAALVMTFLFGTPAAFFIYRPGPTVLSRVLGVVSAIPVVLPPAVAGIALLLAFGRNSPIGALFARFDIGIVFTPLAVILAQFFVSSGFYIQVLGTGIRSVQPEIYEVSYVLGAGRLETFFNIIIPMLSKPVLAGLILAWSRSMGEFGATMMFAGNLEGVTRTMPLEIYTLMQTDITQAAGMSLILVSISFAALFAVKIRLQE